MRALVSIVMSMTVFGTASRALALGFETFGNGPFTTNNYRDWPGAMPLINNDARVYHNWVNGNEAFYYRGDVAAVNAALVQFAAVDSEPLHVVLRPGPGETQTFQRKAVPYDWNLRLVGGIARGSPTLDKEPTLTIYVSKELPVENIVIPRGVTVVTIPELKDRSAALLKSSDKTTRGWGAGKLASLDAFDQRSLDAVASLLKDDDTWVRGNAVGALAVFGAKAKSKIVDLRIAAATGDEKFKMRVETLIEEIEKAPDRSHAELDHRRILEQIDKFVKSQRERK